MSIRSDGDVFGKLEGGECGQDVKQMQNRLKLIIYEWKQTRDG